MLPAYHKAFRLVYDDFILKNDEKPGGKKMEKVKKPIYNHDLTDVTDIITEILRDVRQNGQQLGQ